MYKQIIIPGVQPLFLLPVIVIVILISLLSAEARVSASVVIDSNLFTPTASLLRYWANRFSTSLPIPSILLSKASPLSALDTSAFSKLASTGSLSSHLPSFCVAAGLLCFPDLLAARTSSHSGEPNFATYLSQNFTDHGTYGINGNSPANHYQNNGDSGNTAVEVLTSNRNLSNVGDDAFTFNDEKSDDSRKVTFASNVKSLNEGTDNFKGYGHGAVGANNKGGTVTFAEYTKATGAAAGESLADGGRKAINRWVETGMFFRESVLKEGTLLPMPDIRDKMPRRSFLPRTILSKLPFSTAKMEEMKEIFHADDDSLLARIMADALGKCEQTPSAGETKRCVGSIEDMVDFATSVLGKNIVVRATESVQGSKMEVMIGKVKGIDGVKVTESVSCHQSLFPYLLYYCHSVPKVRVYEADILDSQSKTRINHGVAICHVDTSAWSTNHAAFLALGSGPGRIEVCHWIFQNDMIWTVPN